MTALDKLFPEDLVWTAIQSHLRGTRQSTRSTRFDCPMCDDQRKRGGMAYDRGGPAISCFNCKFTTRWKMGDPLTVKIKAFLAAIGVSSTEIARLNYWAFVLHRMTAGAAVPTAVVSPTLPSFTSKSLPGGARPVQAWAAEYCADPDFLQAIEYLYGRGDAIADAATYYWTPNTTYDLNHRIIIPCFDDGQMVGWTARAVRADVTPKYHNDTPPHLLFNAQALSNPQRTIAIVVEGIFDALALDAVALLGARLHERQALWINSARKQVICLPDRDKAGGRLIDYALQHGWAVSFPRPLSLGGDRGWWSRDIKDAADAVTRYGQLYTLRSVLASATENQMEIRMKRQDFDTPRS